MNVTVNRSVNNTKVELTLAELNHPEWLIYGIGNQGRQDDGLGWAFIEWLEQHTLVPAAQTYRHYQLNLQDADLISHKTKILFVDASKAPMTVPFLLERIEKPVGLDLSFTSHSISIPSIMATCWICFNQVPEVYLLTIKGYEWELGIGLSAQAANNLTKAKHYFSR